MGGAIEAPVKQACPHSYSFYYHSRFTHGNNAGHFISINFTGVDIHLSIGKLCLLTMLMLIWCPCDVVLYVFWLQNILKVHWTASAANCMSSSNRNHNSCTRRCQLTCLCQSFWPYPPCAIITHIYSTGKTLLKSQHRVTIIYVTAWLVNNLLTGVNSVHQSVHYVWDMLLIRDGHWEV